MPLADLTPEQRKAFEDRLKEFQMDPSHVVRKVDSSTHSGPIVLSADPSVSSLRPHIVTLTRLDEAKRLAGNADEDYENGLMAEHHEPLPEWPAERNELDVAELTHHENNLIHKAHIAYLYGHSGRVQSYKAVIEKRNYPVDVATFAIEDLCLDSKNSPLVVQSNAGINVGTLTLCQGGWIKFEANSTITAQVMKKTDAASCS